MQLDFIKDVLLLPKHEVLLAVEAKTVAPLCEFSWLLGGETGQIRHWWAMKRHCLRRKNILVQET